MFKNVTPESVGISSKEVLGFLERFDAHKFQTHSMIMARGNNIFAEMYYAPFNKDFKHRMYSVSKSFVAIAVGLCVEDGLMTLDDKFVSYFPEFVDGEIDGKLASMTIRDMLTMSTCVEGHASWFYEKAKNRCETYFNAKVKRVSGTTFQYDSPGSFMLCAIVEKLTGKLLMDFLKERIFAESEFSKDSYCLKCPGGNSFGDSGVMCTAKDLLIFARFVMNKGVLGGKRLMNSEFLEEAVKKQVDNDITAVGLNYAEHGYGYQIWKTPNDGFAFIGMGDQFAICDPKTDFVFIINSDNQGTGHSRAILYHELYNNIIPNLKEPIKENKEDYAKLKEYMSSRKLLCLDGEKQSEFSKEIENVTYVLDSNPMEIEFVRFNFEEKRGTLTYKNAQGEKQIKFGFGYNEFLKFPQLNYSDMVAGEEAEGNMYDCAVSAAWTEEKKLKIKVQIIDKYFGNLCMTFGFKEDKVGILMVKTAEAFLDEYTGFANGTAEK